MASIEKTVFISCRDINVSWALAVRQDLTQHGYDVFMYYKGLASSDLEGGVLQNIRARAHFLILLTPSALDGCTDPNDSFRREIEIALDAERNIVPLILEGFDFDTPAIAQQLSGRLRLLKDKKSVLVPGAYFDAAMERLRESFLEKPVDVALQAVPPETRQALVQLHEVPPVRFHSCFISYSTRDQEFAQQLYADLKQGGWNAGMPGMTCKGEGKFTTR
jgi:hypothetical protein